MAGMTNEARKLIAQALIGESIVPFGPDSYIGVGDGATAFAADQTDLQGTNKFRKQVFEGFPERNTGGSLLTYAAMFGTADANFVWNEWGVFNAGVAGAMLCRKVENLGTKTSAMAWALTVEIQLNVV